MRIPVLMLAFCLALSVPDARADEALPEQSYRQVLERLRARARERPAPEVRFRLAHLINEDRVPDVPYTLIQPAGKELQVLVPTARGARWCKRGDQVMGARIVEIARGGITVEFRGKRETIAPRPWPTIAATRTQLVDRDWVVYAKVDGAERAYRKGEMLRETRDDTVREALVVEVTPGYVVCEYLGDRRVLPTFPQIPCRLVRHPPDGPVVYVESPSGLRPLKVGERFMEAQLVEVGIDSATFRLRDENRSFPAVPYPDVLPTGIAHINGVWVAFFQGETQSFKVGDTVMGAHIDDIQRDRVRISFQGVSQELTTSPLR